MKIHSEKCSNFEERKIQLSCDGVHENKSTQVSIDVYSLSFKNCKQIYPHKLVRPLGRFKPDSKINLREVLDDINENELRITQYVGDNPKRADAKCVLCHSSWYPCEYCYAKGKKIEITKNNIARKKISDQIASVQEKITECENNPTNPDSQEKIVNLSSLKNGLLKSLNALNRKSNILWPSSTMNAEHRSRASIEEILQKIENNEELSIDERKGIVQRSVLFDLPYFNFVYDVPAEYLHSGCLGLIKRLTELTFNVGTNRQRVTTRKLSPTTQFNKLMSNTKSFKESSRRARSLDFAVFKAQEFRNMCILYFPNVIECIEVNAKERHLWLYLAYMMRASLIPSSEFAEIDLSVVNDCCTKFYILFEELFGMQNCNYNLHLICCHLLEIRTHGPLTQTSAFKFESFYGEMRRAFVPGTISTCKQILKNILLKRAISNHICENKIFISNYETSLESNNLIYCYQRKTYYVYQISEINGAEITCFKVGQYPVTFPELPNLNWSKIGVFKKGGISESTTTLNTSDICGKVLNVGKYLITCPINVLNEK